jgi:hypothetical protein
MREFATTHLRNETYLEDYSSGITIAQTIESEIMPVFEKEMKRSFSITKEQPKFSFPLRGLRVSKTNPRIRRNAFVMT